MKFTPRVISSGTSRPVLVDKPPPGGFPPSRHPGVPANSITTSVHQQASPVVGTSAAPPPPRREFGGESGIPAQTELQVPGSGRRGATRPPRPAGTTNPPAPGRRGSRLVPSPKCPSGNPQDTPSCLLTHTPSPPGPPAHSPLELLSPLPQMPPRAPGPPGREPGEHPYTVWTTQPPGPPGPPGNPRETPPRALGGH